MAINQEVTVTARARGVQELNREVEKTAKALSSGGRAAKRVMKELEGQLKRVTAEQIGLTKAMRGVREGTEQYELLRRALENVERNAKRTESALRRVQQVVKEDRGRGGFFQGLAQGAGVGEYIQRGPGMYRQIAGRAVGRMGAGVPGAITGGLGGFQQGLAGIPIVGGFLAGQFGQQMQFAQRAQAYQTQRLGMAPMFAANQLAGIDVAGQRAARGMRARMAGAEEEIARRRAAGAFEVGRGDIVTTVQETTGLGSRLGGLLAGRLGAELGSAAEMAITPERQVVTPESEYRAAAAENEAKFRKSITKGIVDPKVAARRARAKARRDLFRPIEQAGYDLAGMGREEAMQFMSPILQAGGGGMQDLQNQGMTRAAFAAMRGFGVSGATAGAFQMAGRRGGLTGAEGRGGDALAEAIGDATKIGLEGSEINTYLQQIASGIMSFQQTGIPVNSKSLGTLGAVIDRGTSISGPRAMNIAAGLQRSVQSLPNRGINNQIDLMMLRTVGGYKGGGADALLESFKRMEAGGTEGMGKLISDISRSRGGGASGILGVKSALSKQLGVQISATEAEKITTLAESGQFKALDKKLKEVAPKSAADLEARALEMMEKFGGATKRNAQIQNMQLAAGEKMLPVMEDLAKSSANVNTAFGDIFKHLAPITDDIQKFTAKFPDFVKAIERFADEGFQVSFFGSS